MSDGNSSVTCFAQHLVITVATQRGSLLPPLLASSWLTFAVQIPSLELRNLHAHCRHSLRFAQSSLRQYPPYGLIASTLCVVVADVRCSDSFAGAQESSRSLSPLLALRLVVVTAIPALRAYCLHSLPQFKHRMKIVIGSSAERVCISQ
jgi:hypothetical protein